MIGQLVPLTSMSTRLEQTSLSAIRAYRAQRSDVTLHLAEMESPKQLPAIIESRLDVGFIRSLKDYPDGVSASVIRQARHCDLAFSKI